MRNKMVKTWLLTLMYLLFFTFISLISPKTPDVFTVLVLTVWLGNTIHAYKKQTVISLRAAAVHLAIAALVAAMLLAIAFVSVKVNFSF